MKRALAFAAAVFVAACASIDRSDPASRHYEIPLATTVVVLQPIAIPPDAAHVVLQRGEPVAWGKRLRYEPFCEVEVDGGASARQEIRPGRFAVTRAVRQQQLGATAPPIRLAASVLRGIGIGMGIRLGSLDDGAPFALNMVHLRLQSDEQPYVRELRCAAGWALLPDVVYPTLAEMRTALGGYVRFEIP